MTHTQGTIKPLTNEAIAVGEALGEIPLVIGNDESATIVCTVKAKQGRHVVNPNIAADAHRIVQCWNNHDKLVEALEIAMRVMMKDGHHFNQVTSDAKSDAAKAIEHALNAAKAGAA